MNVIDGQLSIQCLIKCRLVISVISYNPQNQWFEDGLVLWFCAILESLGMEYAPSRDSTVAISGRQFGARFETRLGASGNGNLATMCAGSKITYRCWSLIIGILNQSFRMCLARGKHQQHIDIYLMQDGLLWFTRDILPKSWKIIIHELGMSFHQPSVERNSSWAMGF